jgi:myo-inositol-1(or 4)-monophosphatase
LAGDRNLDPALLLMKPAIQNLALKAAVGAAQAAGALMRRNARAVKHINAATQHDIKLELDVRCQALIERRLRAAFPDSAVFGEEGFSGARDARLRWVVDPIDGTVNFTYGIPHACVSIALQERRSSGAEAYRTQVGVVFDPFCDELWTAIRGRPARLNGRIVHVSGRHRLEEAVVSLGFGKHPTVLKHLLPTFTALTSRVRKLRMMGSAALALTYVASGRFDAYTELGLGLWDVAAGGLIVESAGGAFRCRELEDGSHDVNASNGYLGTKLQALLPAVTG